MEVRLIQKLAKEHMNVFNQTKVVRMSTPNLVGETQRLSLGGQEVWVLPDIALQRPASLFAIGGSDSEIAETVGSAEELLRFSGCPILLRWSDRTILIDAGIGKQDPNVPGMLPQRLAEIGVRPDEVSDILITHLHADHIGGSFEPATGSLLFPNATYHIAEPEIAFWKDPDLSHANRLPQAMLDFQVRTAQRALACLPIRSFTFSKELFPGIEPISSPGHTGGHTAYLLKSDGEQFMIGGDALHHAVLHVRHPEWTTAGDSHPALVHQTRFQLLNRLVDHDILFRCYHFAAEEIGYIRRDPNGVLRLLKINETI
jgi:glyoxylase-like metal-dependent hydrolase (beta-lactamase superfamily II)